MDKETKERIADYFDAWDLVAFLQVSTEEVIAAFEDEIEEALDDIEELIGVRRENGRKD
jgi:hypothetical protein